MVVIACVTQKVSDAVYMSCEMHKVSEAVAKQRFGSQQSTHTLQYSLEAFFQQNTHTLQYSLEAF